MCSICKLDAVVADLDRRLPASLMSRSYTRSGIAKPVRPFALRPIVGLALMSSLLAIAIALAVLFAKAQAQGT
jgi:cytochrome c biogenesis factor